MEKGNTMNMAQGDHTGETHHSDCRKTKTKKGKQDKTLK